jgi:3D (Asp-Asp-Asp) domain-containing protein
MKRIISRSLWRKLLATFVAIVAFVFLYEVTMFDSRDAARRGAVDPTSPRAGSRVAFSATAYCKGTTTASGVGVRTGIAAADDTILPVGSVINVTTDTSKYNGIYTIMDTGPRVQGRILDLYMWSCNEALVFGRKEVDVTVLRLGWNPSASSPSLIDRLFRRREAARNAAPPPIAPIPETAVPPDTVAPVVPSATVDDGATAATDGAPNLAPSGALLAPSHPAPSTP